MQLSWDLHLHPGPPNEGRWGDGRRIWQAARDAGVSGFVWKEHARRIEADAACLPLDGPRCIPSLVLNTWASPEDVSACLAAGVRWFWGPTRDSEMALGWDLPLPNWWPQARELFRASGVPMVVSTGHLDANGRRQLAELAAETPGLVCSVTHSLYLAQAELEDLAGLGCALEHDLFTASFPLPNRPERALGLALLRAIEVGGLAYLTSDAGQHDVGNPFEFSANALAKLRKATSDALVSEVAMLNPAQMAGHLGEVMETI